jgi:hypothetical protein
MRSYLSVPTSCTVSGAAGLLRLYEPGDRAEQALRVELRGGCVTDNFPQAQHDDPVCDLEHVRQRVRDEHDPKAKEQAALDLYENDACWLCWWTGPTGSRPGQDPGGGLRFGLSNPGAGHSSRRVGGPSSGSAPFRR